MTALSFLILATATIPLRNPFWPVGYRGTPEPIDDEPHIRVAVENLLSSEEDTKTSASVEALAAAARDANGSQEMERRWIRARKSLRIGGMMKSAGEKNRQSISINGYIYGDGDLISVNFEGYRFTWRVKKLTENKTLQLVRIRVRELEEETGDMEEAKGARETKGAKETKSARDARGVKEAKGSKGTRGAKGSNEPLKSEI